MEGNVSIIIPVYNREKYLEECLESVLAQSYGDFEVILIDDGSTDGTLDICDKYTILDTRFKLIRGSHEGVSSARNKGLDVAQGEFVFFLDSDDVIHPCLLEILVNEMKTRNAAIGGAYNINVNEKNWYKVKERCKKEYGATDVTYQNFEETLRALFLGESPFGMMGGVILRRDFLGTTRFDKKFFIGEDFLFVYDNLVKGADSVFVGGKGYFNRSHRDNLSWNFDYSGFHNRYCRRRIVWESEENFGRKEYADIQKRQAFGVFVGCAKRHQPNSEESRKMRQFIKTQKNVLFPVMNCKDKVKYFMWVYVPFVAKYIKRVKLKK